MLLLCDRGLDDRRMVCVWDQGDDDRVLSDLALERRLVCDIKGDWSAVVEAFAELLGRFQRAAGFRSTSASYFEDSSAQS